MSNALSITHLTGYIANVFLHGTLTVQVYEYYMDYPNDKSFMKFTVHGLYVAETAHTALTLYNAYTTLALIHPKTHVDVLGISGCILSAMIASIVQVFYAYRIHLLSKRRWVVFTILILSIIQFALGMASGIGVAEKRWLRKTRKSAMVDFCLNIGWFGAFGLCDIIIAVAMVNLLLQSRSSRLAATRRLVRRLMALIIGTGVITAGVSVLCFVLLVAAPRRKPYFVAVVLSMPKLYSNTLLVQLNSRPKPLETDPSLMEHIDLSFVKSGSAAASRANWDLE